MLHETCHPGHPFRGSPHTGHGYFEVPPNGDQASQEQHHSRGSITSRTACALTCDFSWDNSLHWNRSTIPCWTCERHHWKLDNACIGFPEFLSVGLLGNCRFLDTDCTGPFWELVISTDVLLLGPTMRLNATVAALLSTPVVSTLQIRMNSVLDRVQLSPSHKIWCYTCAIFGILILIAERWYCRHFPLVEQTPAISFNPDQRDDGNSFLGFSTRWL